MPILSWPENVAENMKEEKNKVLQRGRYLAEEGARERERGYLVGICEMSDESFTAFLQPLFN